MSTDFIFRIIGMIVFSGAGVFYGGFLGDLTSSSRELYALIMGLVGALIGLVLTPFITIRPIRALRASLGKTSSNTLFASLLGFILGLFIAALLSYPLSLLPSPFSQIMPFVAVVLCAYLGVVLFSSRQDDVARVFAFLRPSPREVVVEEPEASGYYSQSVLLDTSVIIDGRIEDIAKTGFLPRTILIPRFVLNELQHIADSADALRRQRGRRGMDVLSNLQKEQAVQVEINDLDIEEVNAVDEKLILLAKQLNCPVITNDYNMNRVADLQGVKILNINELANAVKAVFLPGEFLSVEVIQEGKEYGQGVGYLDDGTMIVVENGSNYLGQNIDTIVTKVLQTAAGRMIFSRPANH
jgi:uncharacterized protein YacL